MLRNFLIEYNTNNKLAITDATFGVEPRILREPVYIKDITDLTDVVEAAERTKRRRKIDYHYNVLYALQAVPCVIS